VCSGRRTHAWPPRASFAEAQSLRKAGTFCSVFKEHRAGADQRGRILDTHRYRLVGRPFDPARARAKGS